MTAAPAITFDYAGWVLRYPQLAGVPQPMAQLYFNEATIFCQNKLGPVTSTDVLRMLLNMMTAHIAILNSPATERGADINVPPGRISDATEGSVSTSFQNDYPPGTQQWYQQTAPGSAYWAATKAFRLFRYRPMVGFNPAAYGPASFGNAPWNVNPYGGS